jgi:hypothetical protein
MKPTFEGWYYKQQANGKTLAVIPVKSSNRAFIQIITDHESFNIPFKLAKYKKDKVLKIGNPVYSLAKKTKSLMNRERQNNHSFSL